MKKTKKTARKAGKQKITKNMYFYEVLSKYPETIEIFFKHNMHCVGCAVSRFETLEQGALAHGIEPDKLVEELNKKIKKKG